MGSGVEAGAAVAAEVVVGSRGGSVLGKKTILKSDHFPGCQNKRLTPHIDGAPNYRQVGSIRVHGVAMPTINGIINVLNHIGAQRRGKQTQFLWHNLREEPVIYVNGHPFVLRDVERPFSNLEYTGINRDRLEQMEFRLKEDILLEASRYGNKILVTDELPDGQMVDQWEPVEPTSIKTPSEVYEELQQEGYLVDYERVPITDEKAPKEGDFDNLVRRISQTNIETEVIFNCQMGRGRTTTGMVIAVLVYLNRIGASGIPRTSSIGTLHSENDVTDNLLNSEEAIRRGEYTVIRSLLRVLEGGVEGKRQVDKVIDKCDAMQNLREAIATYRNNILQQRDEMKKAASLSCFVEYLERYYLLICFAVYIHSVGSADRSVSYESYTFSEWMKERPELYSILRRLLRRDPMGALGYSNAKPSLAKIVESADDRPQEMGVVAAMRNGAVLGSQTVLKSDHCPGCHNASLPEKVNGAPNFREISGFPVYGVANPTIDGIRAVIEHITKSRGDKPILWHNMREEPVIYINGKPFVLRELERPFKNMLEYTGIDRERVEKMEDRLKQDVLREAKLYGGAIMVIHEKNDNEIFAAWENVSVESIQTPLEVYKSLESEGLPIKYARLPITDGKTPKSSDFDKIASNICSDSRDAAFVFNCQMGQGRTTTGTVIACLVSLRLNYGRPLKMQFGQSYHSDAVSGCSLAKDTSSHNGPDIPAQLGSQCVNEASELGIDSILPVREITRLFDNGAHCREILDAVIDRCSALQNIRQAVLQYRKTTNQQNEEPGERRHALNRAAEYLERYLKLVAFSAYLDSEAFDSLCGQGITKISFKTWMHQQAELQTTKWSIRLRPGRYFNISDGPYFEYESSQGDLMMEAVVKARNGSVLGKGSILKLYHFPGLKKSNGLHFQGAPHFFKANGYPVYSMATPTLVGAREVLSYLGAKNTTEKGISQRVLVIDLREEAIAYINDTPFVLRELYHPIDTLKHVGITGAQAELMDTRLKEDILLELKKTGGKLLLHREEYNSVSNQCSVVGYWENIALENVKTPTDVYAVLKNEGYNVEYRRIPLTREREAIAADIDAIQSCIDESSQHFLFISHTGIGGVAYAMAVTCLGIGASSKLAEDHTAETQLISTYQKDNFSCHISHDATFKQGDYRDILSLTRVLVQGPKSKEQVDIVIDRCAGAGHLLDDILSYKKDLEKYNIDGNDDDRQAYLMDMGIKALRRYFFLITFRSYLHCTSPKETTFAAWMEGRPELRHLCNHLKLDK